ncbi:MAG: hypothetical protein Q4C52_13085 [Eubacteriales bacterium]|nr:hypothetical protein [Eubacteriales bacterium]
MKDRTVKRPGKIKKACIITSIVLVVLFIATFLTYIFNWDMRLMGVVYKKLGKHYDGMERERSF